MNFAEQFVNEVVGIG